MVELLKESEGEPATYLGPPSGLSEAAQAVSTDAVWARIESYVRLRWCERQITWVIEGSEGEDWVPLIGPVVSHAAERWEGGAWVATALPDGPCGLCLPTDGIFRIVAQVGSGNPPDAVAEAFRRLAEYWADEVDKAGVSSYAVGLGNAVEESYSRSASHTARALQNSGAADLLRGIRRMK